MAVQADPSPEDAAVLPQRRPARFRGLDTRERWRYAIWLLVGRVIGVPETWAAVGTPPCPTISTTVEALWSPVAVIAVALIAAGAYHAVRYRSTAAG